MTERTCSTCDWWRPVNGRRCCTWPDRFHNPPVLGAAYAVKQADHSCRKHSPVEAKEAET